MPCTAEPRASTTCPRAHVFHPRAPCDAGSVQSDAHDANRDHPDTKPQFPRLGVLVHVLGAVIAASAALPITPDGRSFLSLVRDEFERGATHGVLMLAGFGSPFLYGLALVLIAWPRLRPYASEFVRTPIGLMHGQLLLVAFVVWRHGEALGALGLLGFAIVGAVAYARSGTFAPGKRMPLVQLVRWGAVMVAGVAAWCRVQQLADVQLGRAVDVLLVAAIGLAVAARPRVR